MRATIMATLVGMVVLMVVSSSIMMVMGAPRAASSMASRSSLSSSRVTSPSPSSSTTTTPSNGVGAAGGRGGHGDDEEPFGLDDIAGGFAFKASGFIGFGGPGSAVPIVPGTGGSTAITAIPTTPQQLWVVVEGRTCSDRKGRCAINAWVNVNGYQTFHIDTRLASSGVSDCQLSVDEFGQGVMVIPIQFTADGGASAPNAAIAGAFPTLITVRFQAFDRDNTYLEIEGCGVAGSPTWGTPPSSSSIQNVCNPSILKDQGRVPLALTGRASRIQFRCSNCKKDDFVIAGDCIDEDNCPAGFSSSGHGSGRGGPGGAANGGSRGFANSGSLDL